ncbi:hypothetical protein C8Q75DRAFT_780948 [Abortiporus biennis]|nr:hypothetical protein C8Q75DRAFT_780948 [Abortiporus biennis]
MRFKVFLILLPLALVTAAPSSSRDESGQCGPKCEAGIENGSFFQEDDQPVDDSWTTTCYYYTPCQTLGLGYRFCNFNTDGTLNDTQSSGETCNGAVFCPNSTRIVCEPPVGTTCSYSCPEFDGGFGYTLIGSSVGDLTVDCWYGFWGSNNPRTFCDYYLDSGEPWGVTTNCQPTAVKTCTTTTT